MADGYLIDPAVLSTRTKQDKEKDTKQISIEERLKRLENVVYKKVEK